MSNDEDEGPIQFPDDGVGMIHEPGDPRALGHQAMELAVVRRCWPEMAVGDMFSATATMIGVAASDSQADHTAGVINMWTSAQNPAMAYLVMRKLTEAIADVATNLGVVRSMLTEMPLPDDVLDGLMEHQVNDHIDRVKHEAQAVLAQAASTLVNDYETACPAADELETAGLVDLQLDQDGGFNAYHPDVHGPGWNGSVPTETIQGKENFEGILGQLREAIRRKKQEGDDAQG